MIITEWKAAKKIFALYYLRTKHVGTKTNISSKVYKMGNVSSMIMMMFLKHTEKMQVDFITIPGH